MNRNKNCPLINDKLRHNIVKVAVEINEPQVPFLNSVGKFLKMLLKTKRTEIVPVWEHIAFDLINLV